MSNRRVSRIGSRALALTLVFAFVFSQLSIANAVCLCETPGAMACCATLPAPQDKGADDGCCSEDAAGSDLGARSDSFIPVIAPATSTCRLGIESSDLAPAAKNQTENGAKVDLTARRSAVWLDGDVSDTIARKAATERGPPGLASRPIYERISSYLI
ncbi:MAG: hypothetical protein HKN20_00630 [Gemmatimonadetes bacterium]|nr:hypothetical protein [Gemmatimonadota bacterium]